MTSWKYVLRPLPTHVHAHTHTQHPWLPGGPTLSLCIPRRHPSPSSLHLLFLCSFSTPRRNDTNSRGEGVRWQRALDKELQPPCAPLPAVPPLAMGPEASLLPPDLSFFQDLPLRLWACDLVLLGFPRIRRPRASLPTLFHLCLESGEAEVPTHPLGCSLLALVMSQGN